MATVLCARDNPMATAKLFLSPVRLAATAAVRASVRIVEVTEVTRGGTPVRTGRFMASRLIALVEHPAQEGNDARVDVTTRRRIGTARRPQAIETPGD